MRLQFMICGLLAISLAACSGANPDAAVEQALSSAQLGHLDAEWESTGQVLHLRGEVQADADRARAEDVARQALDGRGQIVNQITIAGANTEQADDLDGGIETRIENLFESDTALRDRNVDVDVVNGAVTVTGEVQSDAEKNRVTELVRSVPGVTDVANGVTVQPERQ